MLRVFALLLTVALQPRAMFISRGDQLSCAKAAETRADSALSCAVAVQGWINVFNKTFDAASAFSCRNCQLTISPSPNCNLVQSACTFASRSVGNSLLSSTISRPSRLLRNRNSQLASALRALRAEEASTSTEEMVLSDVKLNAEPTVDAYLAQREYAASALF